MVFPSFCKIPPDIKTKSGLVPYRLVLLVLFDDVVLNTSRSVDSDSLDHKIKDQELSSNRHFRCKLLQRYNLIS